MIKKMGGEYGKENDEFFKIGEKKEILLFENNACKEGKYHI